MFEIYDKGDIWEVHSPQGAFSGTFTQIMILCMEHFKITSSELEAAVKHMVQDDHDAIHLGANRTFIYSFKKESKYGRKAS